MRKRAVWVEPLFGEAKDWHGLRRFRLRGLWKVNCEGLLVAAGQNLKRWLSSTGWGRRHGPAGRLALSRRLRRTGVTGQPVYSFGVMGQLLNKLPGSTTCR